MAGGERPELAEVIRALGFDADEIDGLDGRSGWRSVRCPFHEDKNASASANIVLGGFVCYACDVRGDVWSLIMRFENIPKTEFRKAVEWARAHVGYEDTYKAKKEQRRRPYVSPWAGT
jgi:DNA primase